MKLGVNKTFLFHENHHFIQNQPKPATFACDVELLTRRESQSRIQGGILLSLFALFTSVWIQGEPGQERGVYPENSGNCSGPEVYLVERFICNEEAGGSTPPGSTE